VKFDLMLNATPDTIGESIERAKAEKMNGGWVIETKHDPFLLLSAAAAHDTGLSLGTAVAVAFARTPMLLALAGNDLQLVTKGNFILGLGTQVKPHIERRFGMPWGKPVARMREMITAIHAIWDSWEAGAPLNYVGGYYRHTLMTPAFSPGPNRYGRPPIYVGALGPAMTELAGQYADGLVVHRFMTEKFLREVSLPRVRAGLAKRERPLERPFQLVYPPFVAAGDSDDELEEKIEETRAQISFYASTPAYRAVLDAHGWGGLGEKLHDLSRDGKWAAMAKLIDDDMLQTFAVVGRPSEVRDALQQRFDGVIDRIILYPRNAGHQH
jgi:probable F420-dependent oxidoreductase